MRNDLFSRLPEIVAARIKLAMPELRQSAAIAGRFDVDRLKSESVQAPAVLVSLLGLRQDQTYSGPFYGFELELAAFVVTKDRMGLPRDAAAANITQAICGLLPGRRWEEACGEAREVAARAMVTQGHRQTKASLWAVTWRQPAVVTERPVETVLDLSLYLGQSPDVGAGNEASYELVGEGA